MSRFFKPNKPKKLEDDEQILLSKLLVGEEDEVFIQSGYNEEDYFEKDSENIEDNVKERAQWSNSLEFILATIGYAVGLGNVWRFPFLVFKHGGAAFLIPFTILLFIVGIPIFLLETSLGQFSGLSPIDCFARMCPLFKGLGYAAATVNLLIGLYYNVIIAYCIYYLIVSVSTELPWKDCGNVADCFFRESLAVSCEVEKAKLIELNITSLRSPSEVYFYDTVLEITDGIENLGGLNLHLTLCLIVAWICVFLALLKGVQSLGKISYFTATFPYLMLTVLIIRGFQLDGSEKGVEFYIGKFDSSKLLNARLWMDACVQIFYAISSCTGGLISMSSFSAFNNNLIRDTFLVPILDIFTGFYAGFAIFTVLGNMYLTKCVSSFSEVAAQGPELAFVVYPEGLSSMGKAAPMFSFLFFFMMLVLGFGSEFSIMESAMSTIIDMFKNQNNTWRQTMMARFIMCCIFCAIGCLMTTRGGFFILNLIDTYIASYPLLFIGLFEVVVAGWIYGTDRLCYDIECMIGSRSKIFWLAWTISWKFVCPFVLTIVILSSFFMPNEEMNVNGILYPTSAKVFGNLISILPLLAIPWCAFKETRKHRYNWNSLLNPEIGYYNNYKRFLKSQNKSQIISPKVKNWNF